MNRNLITLNEACIRFNKTQNSLTSTVYAHKKKHGNYPKWYIHKPDRVYIDVDEHERLGTLERKAWIYATDKLFWIFADIGMSQLDLSMMMSKRSKAFKTHQSWNTFLSKALFNVPPEITSGNEKSMRIEFVKYGTKIVRILIKNGYLIENDGYYVVNQEKILQARKIFDELLKAEN